MNKYDYLIIGGGLSGSLLGYLLKKQNKNVLIIERQSLKNKSKLCAGILTNKAYKLLINIFNKNDIDKLIQHQFNSCKVLTNYELLINKMNIRIIDRNALDKFILDEYLKLGGQIKGESTFDITDKSIEYDYLIAADGALSSIRKQIEHRLPRVNLGLESFYTSKKKELVLEFKNDLKGYIWHIDIGDNSIIGVGDVSGNTNIKYKEMLGKYKGAFLPNGNDILLKKDNTYFVGDAAGLISPITGEGIYYAILSSIKLSDALVHHKSYRLKMMGAIIHINYERFSKIFIYNKFIRNAISFVVYKTKILSKIIIVYVKWLLLK